MEDKKYIFGQAERPEQESLTGYKDAPDHIIELAEKIIKERHSVIKECRILYLMSDDEIKWRGNSVPGRAYKVNDREKTKLKKDIEIVISEEYWHQATEENKQEAAMDYLLSFITPGKDAGMWTTRDPDFFGFYNNIQEYGMWDRSLKNLQQRLRMQKLPLDGVNNE